MLGDVQRQGRIAAGDPLDDALAAIVRLVECGIPRSRCSILLLARDGARLHVRAGAGIPHEYEAGIDGIAIGPHAGSCGTAAWRREPVIAADIATDPLWADYRELALRHGLRACWSVPILGSDAERWVLGTVAVYLDEPGTPQPGACEVIERAAHLAQVAIERELAVRALRESEQRFRDDGSPHSPCRTSVDVSERKTAAQSLELQARVLDGMTEAVCLCDEDGIIVYTNPAHDRMFGYARGELFGRHVSVLNQPTEAQNEPRIREVERALRKRGEWSGEWPNRHKDGAPFLGFVRITSVQIGERRYVASIQEDITERKAAEERLRQSDERYRLAILATNDAIWDIDVSTGAVLRSERYDAAFGTPSDREIPWQWWLERIHPDDRERAEVSLRAAIDGSDRHWSCAYRFRRRDGAWAHVEDRAHIARDAAGRAIRIVGALQDVTERKRAQEERDRLWNYSLDLLCIAGEDGFLKQVNPAFSQTLGWSEAELLHRPWSELVHPDDVGATKAMGSRLRRGEAVTGMVNRLRCKDGSYRWLSWTAFLLPEVRLTFGVARDVTESKRLEEQLRQAQKMEAVGQLAGGVAHDFNNLLTVINGFSEVLLEELPADDPKRELVEAIRDSGERAGSLTAQLLAFSRKAIVEPKVVDVNEVIEAALRMLRRMIGEDIDLLADLRPGLGRVRIDPSQLEQVLMNLAVNARDAMPCGGQVILETSDVVLSEGSVTEFGVAGPGRYTQLSVTDGGGGMTEEVRSRIFEPFFTTKSVGKGTGLGLATVYGVVRQASGHVRVRSELGKGTTFCVLLPVVEESSTVRGGTSVTLTPGGRETVLLVEDEDSVRSVASLALKKQGYTVIESRSGSEAIRASGAHPGTIHLLVTDVVMPGLGGPAVAEALRAQRPDLRVLYVSGYTDDAVLRPGLGASDGALLPKPFTPMTLAARVREVLDAAP